MSDKIKKHPALLYSQDLKDICAPLNHLNISYFSHVHIDNTGNFSALSNNPEFHEHYLNNKYYDADIHMAKNNNIQKKYIIWDEVKCSGQSKKLYEESKAFGADHTFTLIDKNKVGKNYYHFATHLSAPHVNYNYLSNFELLQLFILHFKHNISQSKTLSEAYNLTFTMDNKAEFLFDVHREPATPEESRSLFLKKMKLNVPLLKKCLTMRELEI